jgi:hypothetical protein
MYIDSIDHKKIAGVIHKLYYEIECEIEEFQDPDYKKYFIKKVEYILNHITLETSKNHNMNCIVVAVFNLICKYSIDYFYYKPECPDNTVLELDILSDIEFKLL